MTRDGIGIDSLHPRAYACRVGPLLVASLAAYALAAPPAATVPNWSLTATQDIVFFRLTPLGTLVVSTSDGLFGVDPVSGAVTWKRDDIRGLPGSRFQTVPGSGTALANLDAGTGSGGPRIELLDLETGGSRWDSRALGIGATLGHLFVPHRRLVMMYTVPPGESSLTWQATRRGPWTFVAVNVADGRLAWVTDHLVRAPPITTVRSGSDGTPVRSLLGAGRGMVFDTDSTAILDISREGPIRLDLISGERLWPTVAPESLDTRGAPGTARMALDERAVYAPRRDRLQALSLTDGHLLWERPDEVHDLRMTPRGLLVSTSLPDAEPAAFALGAATSLVVGTATGVPFIPTDALLGNRLRARHLDLLDPRTGESLWPKRFDLPRRPKSSHAKGDYGPFDVRGDTVYVGGDQSLRGIRLTDGRVVELAKYGLGEDEWPEGLEARASGVVLRTRDALISLDPTTHGRYGPYGATRYHLSVPGPKLPAEVSIGASLLVVGLMALLVSTALTDAQDTFNDAYGPYLGPVVYSTSGMQEGIPAAGVVAGMLGIDYVLSIRFRATRLAESFLYVLTTVRDSTGARGPGIARVNKDSGKVESRVMLRYRADANTTYGDRNPVFEVDDIAGRLYYRNSARTIACFAF